MRVDLRKLSYAVAVGRHLSFSRAANELGITQPALSRSIAALEAEIGAKLFDRDRVGVGLTRVGTQLVADAERLLSQASILEHNVGQWSRAEAGSVVLGIGPLPASIFLSELLASLTLSHPGLIIDVRVAPAAQLLEEISADRVELVVCSKTFVDDPSLSCVPLFDVPIGLFVRAMHPLAGHRDVDLSELRRHPLASSRFVSHREDLFAGDGAPTIICDDYAVLKRLMLSSDVVWLGSSRLVERELSDGLVVPVRVSAARDLLRTTITASWRENRVRSPAASLLLSRITQLPSLKNKAALAG